MPFSLSRWRARHLLAAWSAYWLGLAAVTLTPIVLAIHRATQSGAGVHGKASVSASFGDAGVGITITRLGETVLHRAVGVLPLALWIVGPPLVLWGAWLRARSRAIARSRVADGPASHAALAEPHPEFVRTARGAERSPGDARPPRTP